MHLVFTRMPGESHRRRFGSSVAVFMWRLSVVVFVADGETPRSKNGHH